MSSHTVAKYIHNVIDGSIPACELVRQAVERHLRDMDTAHERGLKFDRQAAQHAIDFFGFLRHSKGEWSGQPFVLSPWQQFITRCLFGWKRVDGYRRFRTAYLEVPRKNGKTTWLAGVGLYLLVADGESGAEVYSAATMRDQAKLSWGEAARMVKSSPLGRMVRLYKASSTLVVEQTASKFAPLGADADTMDGLNVHGALIDELHAHKSRAVIDVLDTATGARRQPLIIEITTAGNDQNSVCFEHHDYSRRVLNGTVADDSWFAFISTIDEGDDWSSPEAWAKANPNLGVSVKVDDLAMKCERAKRLPAAQNAFRRLHLCQWTQQSDRWIDLSLWDENAGRVVENELLGEICYGGLDLSSVQDITAWVMVFPTANDPELVRVIARFWLPESKLSDDGYRYVEQYRVWARQGYLQLTPGDAIDYQFVKRAILDDAMKFKLRGLNVDRLFQGYQLSQELVDEGIDVAGMGQGFLSMAAPMRELERRLLAKKIHHGGNPVLRWMADNVAVKMDAAGNLKPDKASSQGKIDGIVALVMALDRQMRSQNVRASAYEEHGLFVV